ncbi:GDP-mannose 4,6-dehydratase [Methanothrix thermoacetophila]|uniref:NAD-dependent epimerase/dehydratase n=1 Tax=Methanothrix thermoacetophila (strain DSM 6194 / JCM 14653 / NBRC 101360 / PT) TaxID=349307 RepID=A0B823_METTP|nr:GDP-mannose 4,6-dehydratase [Methanothrix thermoacetophila]ABK14847.1 NAD-dependent epimerase/dehydratase [Methanothrix thermoacetophila PT]
MDIRNKNILITGVSGFVGSRMARRLVDAGASVYGLVRRRSDGRMPVNLERLGIKKDVRLIEGDLENISSIGNAITASDPDIIFHLAAQSFVPRSFVDPNETMLCNCWGTSNLLEAVRLKDVDATVVFAGSSEEYGLVISSEEQYKRALEKYGAVFPEPERIPELPISETNPLRPMSPYAVSKVYGDYLMRNYWHSYGIPTVVSRAFNHEGAGRGIMFVTSVITSQVMKLKLGEIDGITIGNVNAFRDWSHVDDIIDGYILLAVKAKRGDVYNQGSMRTNSVLSYILMSLEEAGYPVSRIETFHGEKIVDDPTEPDSSPIFGLNFDKTTVDGMMLRGELEFVQEDGGIIAHSGERRIRIVFERERFRPAEVPILLSDTRKIESIGFMVRHTVRDIIRDQLDQFLSDKERK